MFFINCLYSIADYNKAAQANKADYKHKQSRLQAQAKQTTSMETQNYYNFYDEKTIFKKTNTTPSFTYGLSSLSQKSKINPEIVEVCMLHISNQRKQRGYTIEPEQFG